MSTDQKSKQEEAIEALKETLSKAKLRGGFAIKGSINIEKDLMGRPVSLSGEVHVAIEGNGVASIPTSKTHTEKLHWNILGRYLKNNPMLDLITTE